MPTQTHDLTPEIDRKLDILISLLAYQVAGEMTVAEGAPILRRLGMNPTEIAAVFGSTTGAVQTRIKEARKRSSKKAAR
jgi:hypothetical protein